MSTNNPSTSPTEAPQKLADLHETTKQKVFLDEITSNNNLSDAEKKSFTEKYQKAINELLKKYEGKKDVVISEISDILQKFKESLQHEKNDDDDATEFSSQSPDTNKTDVDTEKKLGDKEIDEHIKQLSDKIESKLNAPSATPEKPTQTQTTQQVIEKTLWDLNISADIPSIPNDYESKNKPSGFVNIIIKFLSGIFPSFANYLTMKTMGYKTEKQMEYTKTAMNNLLSIKESPISSIIRLDDITEREYRQILANQSDLDFSTKENVEAALLGKHADNPKYKKYHRIYIGIEKKAEELASTEWVSYNPVERLERLLDCSKDDTLTPTYETEDNWNNDAPTTTEVPPIKSDAQKLEEQKQEIKNAQEADMNLEKAKKDLETAKTLPDSPDKGSKVSAAEANLKTCEDVVKNIVEKSKTKVGEMLRNVENSLQDTKLTKEQKNKQKKTLESQLTKDPNNSALKDNLATLTSEIRNLEIKEKSLKETRTKIKIEQEKFPADSTKNISATAAQEAAQEAERLANEGKEVVQTQQTKEEKEKTDEEVKSNLEKIETEINNKIYSDEVGEKNKIDSLETVKIMKEKIAQFSENYSEEVLQKLWILEKKKQLIEKLEKAEGKIQLIKDLKVKEKDMLNRGRNINYENSENWIEKTWSDTLEVDIDGNPFVDETFLTKNHPTITAVWGLDRAVDILKQNTEQLSIGDGADYTSKDGTKFKIKI